MRRQARRRRAGERGITAVEAAVAFAIVGVALATTVPACIRSVHLARTAEAVDNVTAILTSAARVRTELPKATLVSAPLTPAAVPRGQSISDAPGTWDHPTWKTIGFEIEDPHWYSYQLDVDPDALTPLRVVAHGDLDGDGLLSTFERSAVREGAAVVPRPGLTVSSDLE